MARASVLVGAVLLVHSISSQLNPDTSMRPSTVLSTTEAILGAGALVQGVKMWTK